MARPPASHKVSRLVTTLLNGAIWWLILFGAGWAFSGGGKVAHVAPLVMANIVGLSFLFIPYFATHSVIIGLLDGVLKQRISLPEAGSDASARPGNAWQTALIHGLSFGLLPAAIGYFVAFSAATDTVTPGMFAMRYASAGALLAAAVAWYVAGAPFLHAARVPHGRPAQGGDAQRYLWKHFAWPHGIANAVINGALAFALSPVPFAHGTAIVPARNVTVDTAITLLILAWLMISGARTQARVEAQWGIAPAASASDKSVLVAALIAAFAGLLFSVLVGVGFWVTHAAGMGIFAWAVYRGLVCGVYTALVSKGVARAVVRRTLAAAPSATRLQAA